MDYLREQLFIKCFRSSVGSMSFGAVVKCQCARRNIIKILYSVSPHKCLDLRRPSLLERYDFSVHNKNILCAQVVHYTQGSGRSY